MIYSGFVAQDVEKSADETGYDFSGVDAPKNEHDLYGLRYADFVVPLVKAVQELDSNQRLEAESRNSEVNKLQEEIEELKSQIVLLQSSIENRQPLTTSGFAKLESLNTTAETILGQNIPILSITQRSFLSVFQKTATTLRS
jgi:hypothetical protein